MEFWLKSVKPFVVALGLGVTLLAAQPVWAKVVDRVVATVNGVIVTLSTVQERAAILKQQMQASGGSLQMGEREIIEKTLDSIIEEKLQLQEAKRAKLMVDENAVRLALDEILSKNNITIEQMEEMLQTEGRSLEQYKNHIRDQILTSKVMQYQMGRFGKVPNRQIKKYYFQHQKDFWESKKPFVRHILFIVDEDASEQVRASKREQADRVLKQVQSGADFSELAKNYSEDVSASSGGEVGWLTRGHLVPEFEEVAFRLKPGEVSDIVESRYGFHIVKVDKVSPGKAKPLDKVKVEIERILSFEARQKKYKSWMDDLKKNSVIQITMFKDVDAQKKPKQKLELEPAPTQEEFWEEASSVKSKREIKNTRSNRKNFQVMERKLTFMKRLRKNKKITDKEYQARKRRLLDQL